MSCHTVLFEFKVSCTLFQNQFELASVKRRLESRLEEFGFFLVNANDRCPSPGFMLTYQKKGW